MHIPNTYHKLVRQRHHELHPKEFNYDDQNISSMIVALQEHLESYITRELKIKMLHTQKMPSIYREIPPSRK